MARPENAHRPWTSEEEARMVRAFDAGATVSQLARQRGRTRQAIHGRLYRLGKVSQWRLPAPRGGEPDPIGVRQQASRESIPSAATPRGRLAGLNAAARAL